MTQPNFKQILPFVVHTTLSAPTAEEEPLPFKPPTPADNDINFDGTKSNPPMSPSITTAILVTVGLALTGWIFIGSSEKKPENRQISLVSMPVIPPSVINASEKTLLSLADKTIPTSTTLKTDTAVLPLLEEQVKLQISTVAPPVGSPPLILAETNTKNQEQSQAFIARAERMIRETKDIGAARLFLERALALGNQKAAFNLGETYNPAVLRRLGVKGMPGDIKRARELYELAAANGIEDAKRKLSELQ